MRTEQISVREKKNRCRAEGLRRRAAMGETARKRAGEQILARLTDSDRYREAGCILTYVSWRDEVDTRELIRRALADGKRVCCPKTDPEKKKMRFFRIGALEELRAGFHGIPEPDDARGEIDPGRDRESGATDGGTLFIMPGCAFDKDRRRIGYGGGYYDRFLREAGRAGDMKGLPEGCGKIALCFSCQILEELPEEETDIRPDLLLTEHGFI